VGGKAAKKSILETAGLELSQEVLQVVYNPQGTPRTFLYKGLKNDSLIVFPACSG